MVSSKCLPGLKRSFKLKRIMRRIKYSVLFLILTFVLCACGKNTTTDSGDPLVGRWEYQKTFDYQYIIFNEDGTYEQGYYPDVVTGTGTYTVDGNAITIIVEKQEFEYEYVIDCTYTIDERGILHLTEWNNSGDIKTSITKGWKKVQ